MESVTYGNGKPYMVLVGPVGSGKTTLTEKLSNKKNLGVAHSGRSATRVSTVYQAKLFEFADTPGYLDDDHKINHAVNIIRALEKSPISRIFVLVKWESRISTMIKPVRQIVAPLVDYLEIITIIITAWDLSDGTLESKTEIETEFTKKLNINTICFVGKATSGEELENLLIATAFNPRILQIPPDKISEYFDITKDDFQIMNYIKAKTNEYNKLYSDTVKQAKETAPDQQEDFVFYAQIALKGIIVQFKEDFITKFGLRPEVPEEFACIEQLYSELTGILKIYRTYCKQFRNFDAGCDTKQSPLRKCPNCNLVWMKVQGCSGETTCGARPNYYDRPKKTKWSWHYVSGKLFYRSETITLSEPSTPAVEKNGVGCGSSIEWKYMPSVLVPPEMTEAMVDTEDIPVVTPEAYDKVIDALAEAKINAKLHYA